MKQERKELKKFNLEEALAGQAAGRNLVVTRDGRAVTQLVKFEGVCVAGDVYGVVDCKVYAFTSNGEYLHDSGSCLDLFIAPEKKWTNLYYDPEEHNVVCGKICDSKEEALDNCSYDKGGMKYIDTISFEI